MMKSWKYIVFALILTVMVIPFIANHFKLLEEKPLFGDQSLPDKPAFSKTTWLSGDYQTIAGDWIKTHIGFYNSLVRTHNQLDYSLFGKLHAEGVLEGKNGQFYEKDYIRAWAGEDFIGEKILDKKMRQFRFLQGYLKDSLDIDLVLVLEPGKASVYPEDIPDRYSKAADGKSNYDYIVMRAAELGIQLIDLNAWFISIRDTAKYPLYPLQGTHWSEFAMWYAADSLIRYIETVKNIDLPEVWIEKTEVDHSLRTTDYDVGRSLNLIWELDHGPMPYHQFAFHSDSGHVKPNILSVADSYYWNFYNSGIPDSLFSNKAFWYFYKKVYPDTWYGEKTVKDIDLKAEVEKQDVIFLMMTERFLYKFDRGFVDDLFSIYGKPSTLDRIGRYISSIVNLDSWFSDLIRKADNKGISLGEMMELDANYMLKQGDPDAFYRLHGPSPVTKQIRENKKWYESVRKNAVRKNISINEQIMEEAVYLLRNERPDALDAYNKLTAIKDSLLADSAACDKLKNDAAFYYLTEEEMLQATAEEILKQE